MRALHFTAAFLIGLGLHAAVAQAPTETDAKISTHLAEHPESGILVVDAVLRDQDGKVRICGPAKLHLVGAERKNAAVRTQDHGLFGRNGWNGGVAGIKAGTYLVGGISCQSGVLELYRGNFAKITIRPGEILAAGTLVVDYKREGSVFSRKFSGSAHVEDFSPTTLQSLKTRFPATMAKAKKSLLVGLTDKEKQSGIKP